MFAQTTVYWDTNSTTAGASGGTTANGTWDASTTSAWSTSSAGTSSTTTWNGIAGGKIATFAAGTNATGSSTITVSGTLTNVAGITFEEGTFALSGGTLTLSQNATFGTGANNASISSVIAGGGFGVTKTGTGTLTLSGANTYTGVTTISAGTLSVSSLANGSSASGIGQSSNGASNLVLNGGTLKYTGAATSTNRQFTLGASGGTLDASGTGALNFTSSGGMTASGTGNRTLTLTGTNTGNNTLAAVIGNPGTGSTSVTKTGTGTWVLTGNNSYSGATTISNGILSISSFGALGNTANALVLDGGTFQYTGAATTTSRLPTLTANGGTIDASGSGTLGFTSGSTILFSGSGTRTLTLSGTNTGNNAFNNVIADSAVGVATSVVKNGSGTWLFDGNNANTYTGDTTVNSGTLLLDKKSGKDATGKGNIIVGDGTSAATVKFYATNNQLANSATIYLNNNGTFDVNGLSDSLGAIADGSLVSGGFGQVLLGSGSITVGASNTSTIFSGVISGTGTVSKSGSGTWTLAGNNTFSGGLTLNAGGIAVRNAGALGTGQFTIGSGTTIDNTSGSALTNANNNTLRINGSFTFTGSNDLNLGTGATTLAASSTITTNGSSNLTFGGVITDGGSTFNLTKSGAGTLTLSGANTYTGVTTVSAGTLSVNSLANGGSASAIGNSNNTATNLVINGGTLKYTGAATTSNRLFSIGTSGGTIDSSGSGLLTFSNTGSMGFNGQSGARTLTLTGSNDGVLGAVIGDSGGATALTKTGAGTWTLTGANTFSGTTTISAGELEIGSGGTSGTLGSGSVVNNALLTLNRSDALTVSNAISGSGAVSKVAAGTTTLSGSNSYTGGTTVSAGTLKLSNVAGMGAAGAAVALSGGNLDLATDTSVNAYNATVSSNATIYSDKATAASAGITHTLGTLSIGAQTLSLASGSNVATNSSYGLTFGATTLTGGATFNVANNGTGTGTLTLGTVSQSGTQSLTKTGAGTLTFGGSNSYTGGTTLSAGAIIVNSGAQLAGATGALTVNGGTLTLNNAAQTVASLNGSGGTVALGSGHSLTINSSGSDSYAGAFSGIGNTVINKTNTGTLTLSGSSTSFAGTLNVNQGKVIASSANALGGSSATTVVASGAALGLSSGTTISTGNLQLAGTGVSGSGALYNVSGTATYGGATTVNSDATIAAATGTLNVSGSVNLAAAATGDTTLTLNPASGAALNVSGQLTDGVSAYRLSVQHTGNGTVTLSNSSNNYYGNTTIGSAGGTTTGTLAMGASNALPAVDDNSLINIYSGTLNLNNFDATAFGSINMGGGGSGSTAAITTGTGTLTLNHNLTYSATNNPNGATISGKLALTNGTHLFTINDSSAATYDTTISAVISGTAEIDKYGSGTLLLTGANTYSASTVVQAGILNIQNNNALGSTAGGTNVNSGATLQLSNVANGNLSIGDALTISGSGVGGNGALQNVAGTNTWTGGITVATTNARIQADSGTTLNISTGGINSATSGSLEVGGAGNTNVSSSIGTGVTGVTKKDGGTLTLSGGNAFSGPVSVQGGTLSAQNNTALGSNNTTTVSSGATLAFDSTANGALTVANGTINLNGTGSGSAGALRNTAGSNQFSGTVNLQSSSTITANAGTTLTLGTVTGTGGSTLTFGTASQNGSVTVAGALSNANGTMNLTKVGAASGSDGRLTLSGGGTVGTVSLSQGAMTVQSNTLNTGSFTASAGTSLLVAAGGTVNITGNGIFNSGTIDNASVGTIQVNGNNSLTFYGTINASNATLVLNGNSGAPLTVYLGGANVTFGTIEITGDTILDFGNSAGTILTSGALKITNPSATIQVKNWTTVANQSILSTIWKATSTVNNTTLGSNDSTSSPLTQISFVNPSGSIGSTTTWVSGSHDGWFDHEIRPTPEPSTYGAILMTGCLGLLGWRRYRRSKTAA